MAVEKIIQPRADDGMAPRGLFNRATSAPGGRRRD
jgi:hypothetical protein